MHYVMRSKCIILGLILTLVLASCSDAPAPKAKQNNEDIYYVAKIDLSANDTQSQIESEYDAKVIFFNKNAGFAVLGFSKEAGELTSLSTSANHDAFKAPEVNAQGFNSWAGGFNSWAGGFNSWAGGYNSWAGGFNAWAGGYNAWAGGYNAWAGGYDAWAGGVPMASVVGNNMHAWDRINLAEVQLRAPNLGEDVVLAVIDTGIDLYHPALKTHRTNWTSWWDFVEEDDEPYDEGDMGNHGLGHGTAVASLILQVAPKAKIMPLRVLNRYGSGDTDDIVSAISWAVDHGADIINLSLGTDSNDPILAAMVKWASSEGIYVVTSAGNSNNQNVTYPAAYANNGNRIISVGSVGLRSKKADFSNYSNTLVDLVAPGKDLIAAFPDNRQATVQGTSFSAPLVSGAIALALGEDSSNSSKQIIKSKLRNSAKNINAKNPNYNWKLGKGLLDIEKFLMFMGNDAPTPNRKALFIAGNTVLSGSDEFFKERLELLGFAVTVKKDSQATFGQAVASDLVLISNTVEESNIGARFLNVAVPLILWEDALYEPMSLAWDSGDISSQQYIRIAKNHPLSAGFAKYKSLKVYNSGDNYERRFSYGKTYQGAIKIAQDASHQKDFIFAYEKGAALGTVHAAAKRVGMFFQNHDDMTISNYGAALFDAAVVWATNNNYLLKDKTWIEAESPSSVSGAFEWGSGGSWEISSAAYMTTANSIGKDLDGDGYPNAKASYNLKVDQAGYYNIWLRGYGPNGSSNSFWVQFDNGSKQAVHFTAGDWVWRKTSKYLSDGNHTLTILLREGGTKLDKIMLTKSNYTPTGLGAY